jgi:hypothetical protein
VRQRDFLEIHPALSNISINVPRTDGSITAGGNLSEEPWQFLQKMDELWAIQVLFKEPTGEIKNKYMKLQDIDKSGVPEETIEEWLTTLDTLYKDDWEENKRAQAEGGQKEYIETPGIITVMSNGMVGRAFVPPE